MLRPRWTVGADNDEDELPQNPAAFRTPSLSPTRKSRLHPASGIDEKDADWNGNVPTRCDPAQLGFL